jgi:hypothetical protein
MNKMHLSNLAISIFINFIKTFLILNAWGWFKMKNGDVFWVL